MRPGDVPAWLHSAPPQGLLDDLRPVVEAANRLQNGVAYWGHVGGLITGAVLFILLRPTRAKLFYCAHSEPVLVTGK
jgi:hypothetical protein